jgi:hypothetical protein
MESILFVAAFVRKSMQLALKIFVASSVNPVASALGKPL